MENPDKPLRAARVSRSAVEPGTILDVDERSTWAAKFGVAGDQIDHDFMISHLLVAISEHADKVVFFGGTALSRTVLPDLRLSEDIDLLAIGQRKLVARAIDDSIREYFEPRFGAVDADPWLADTRQDVQPCLFHAGHVDVQIQLLDGSQYPNWPTQTSAIEQRYTGLSEIALATLTPEAFVGAKTSAWLETSRNAPRDLYDLWALAIDGQISVEAARLFKKFGPTGGYPNKWLLPAKPPTEDEWLAALEHQCIPQVTVKEAYETVIEYWNKAVEKAHGEEMRKDLA